MFAFVLFATLSVMPAGHVTDLTASLTPGQMLALETKLRDYREQTKNEIAVLAIPALPPGESVESYANKIFHDWGIGVKGVDNGVLLLWSKGDRKIRIEVGYGLEPSLPDGRAGQIIREEIAPRFKKGDWFGGLDYGTSAILAQLQARKGEAVLVKDPVEPAQEEISWTFWLWIFTAVAATVAILAWIFRDKKSKPERSYYSSYSPPAPVVSSTRKSSSSSRSYSSSPSYIPVPYDPVESSSHRSSSPSRSWDSGSSSSSWSSSSDSGGSSSSFGGFSGGDSGGGGASGGY
jgi:uncharacterized protein